MPLPFACRKNLLCLPICRRGSDRHISEPYRRLRGYNRHRPPLELFLTSFFIQIYILYAVSCCPVRRDGRQYLSRPLSSRHWLSACAVGSLRDPCRCVPIRCNTCQSYSINTAGALTSELEPCMILPAPSLW